MLSFFPKLAKSVTNELMHQCDNALSSLVEALSLSAACSLLPPATVTERQTVNNPIGNVVQYLKLSLSLCRLLMLTSSVIVCVLTTSVVVMAFEAQRVFLFTVFPLAFSLRVSVCTEN